MQGSSRPWTLRPSSAVRSSNNQRRQAVEGAEGMIVRESARARDPRYRVRMDGIAHVLVTRSKVVLAATAVLTLFFAAQLLRFQINADITEFITAGNERGQAYVALQDKYGGGEPIMVLLSLPDEGPDFGEPVVLGDLVRTADGFRQVEGVAHVAALVPEKNPLTGAAVTAEEIEGLPKFLLSKLVDGPGAALMLSEDARHTLVMVVPDEGTDAVALAREVDDVELPARFDVVYAGNPVIFAAIFDMLGWFILVIPPTVLVLLLGVFYATIGVRKLAALSVVPAIIGSIWTFGLIFGLGHEIDIVTVIVPVFVIVMGSADGLHFVVHYRETTGEPVERVASTLRQVGVPMILTTVSTAAGFLSLLATDIRPMRQMGTFVAVGICVAGLISFFTLPALLSRLEIPPATKPAPLGKPAIGLLRRVVGRPLAAVVLVLGLGAFAAIYLPKLGVDANQLVFFQEDSEVVVAFDRMTEAFGGATPLTGEFVWDPDGDRSAQLTRIRELSRELEQMPSVRRVFSIADAEQMIRESGLPDTMRQQLFDPEGSFGPGRMVSEDGLRFVLMPAEYETADVNAWRDFAESHEEIRTLGGMPMLFEEMSRMVVQAQIGSLGTAFALVSLMLLLAYRRLRPTLIALAPMVLTTATLLAFIAASGIQLHLLSAIASSIVIGVGIDYAIHFIAAIEYARTEGPGYLHRAVGAAGPPIVANALGIALALTALQLSPLRPHTQISWIMWVSMITAAVTSFVLIGAAYRERDSGG